MYFEAERHQSSWEMLVEAPMKGPGVEMRKAEVVRWGCRRSRERMREQIPNGVYAVPYIVIEGRKRDWTLVGLKDVEEHVKALETIIKKTDRGIV